MSKQHLDLFAFVARGFVAIGLPASPCNVAGGFVFLPRDGPMNHVGAAFGFERTVVAVQFGGSIFGRSTLALFACGVGVVATTAQQLLTLGQM